MHLQWPEWVPWGFPAHPYGSIWAGSITHWTNSRHRAVPINTPNTLLGSDPSSILQVQPQPLHIQATTAGSWAELDLQTLGPPLSCFLQALSTQMAENATQRREKKFQCPQKASIKRIYFITPPKKNLSEPREFHYHFNVHIRVVFFFFFNILKVKNKGTP